jgi:hypothetical protein
MNSQKGGGMRSGGGQGQGGGGWGWRNMFFATGLPGWMRSGVCVAPYQKPDPEMEKQMLKNQAEILQSELDSIKKRLGEIDTRTPAE